MLSKPEASSIGQKRSDLEQKSRSLILQFGDLDVEENRVRLVEAMILNHVIPGYDPDTQGLEAALFDLPRSTVDKLIATFSKLNETRRQNTALLLKGFQDRDVP